jgi:hypothetical protein
VSGPLLRALALLGCLALSSCSLGGGEAAPKPIRGAPRKIAAVVAALDRATRDRDYASICNELFTRAARGRAGGRDCERLMRSTARDVRRPSVELVSIRVKKGGAEARVRTRAAGQALLEDVIVLRLERGRYRIEGLGG